MMLRKFYYTQDLWCLRGYDWRFEKRWQMAAYFEGFDRSPLCKVSFVFGMLDRIDAVEFVADLFQIPYWLAALIEFQ